MLVSTILVIYGTEFFLTSLVIHNNGLTQAIPTNNNSAMATGISEHALNSEHVLRDA